MGADKIRHPGQRGGSRWVERMGRAAMAGNSRPVSPAGADWLSGSKEIFSKAIGGIKQRKAPGHMSFVFNVIVFPV